MPVTGKRAGRQLVSILPQLSVRGGLAALDFYRAAFGAEVVYQVGGTAENPSVVAELSVDGAGFWVADESPEHANFSPESVGGSTTRMLLIVSDPQATIERAVLAGATLVYPAIQEHGWLLGRVHDPFGHHWEIGKPLVAWHQAGEAAAHDEPGAEPQVGVGQVGRAVVGRVQSDPHA